MSSTVADNLLPVLQKLIDGFALDVGRVRAALADEKSPAEARKTLVGALNYVLDTWDMFPDHYKGAGVADDAIVLRLAAAQAVEEGASHRGVQQLAGDLSSVRALLGELTEPLAKLVATFRGRAVKERTPAAILEDDNVRAIFEADLNRMLKKHESARIAPGPGGPNAMVNELRKMVRAALQKAGVDVP